MGPTDFLPATHTATCHDALNGEEGDGAALAALLDTWPIWRGELGVGDVSLYDSRLLHAGGANTSQRRRH